VIALAEWFVSAKHAPPVGPSQPINRVDLIAKIEIHRHRCLLVVQAPAGYGKTMLLSQWHARIIGSGASAAWISLEPSDDSEGAFVAALALALRAAGILPDDDTLAPLLERSPQAALDALIARAGGVARETWLNIDDWHHVESVPMIGLLESLLRRMPANWHIALASRKRPRLALAALRASDQVMEIGAADLCFSIAETRQMLQHIPLAGETIPDLHVQTEGWPLATRLARLRLEKGHIASAFKPSFLGSIDGMADYIGEEIVAGLPGELKAFLVDTSICDSFSVDLADALRGSRDALHHMAQLRSLEGMIVAIDDDRQWFRPHPLFAEYLERQRRMVDVRRLVALHTSAADWFENNGQVLEAVDHARSSGDEARTIRLVENANCVDLCIRIGAPAVRALLDRLPPQALQDRPRLRAAHAAVNLKLGSIAGTRSAMAELREALQPEAADDILERDLFAVENLWLCFIDTSPTQEEIAAQRDKLEKFGADEWWLQALMYNAQGRLEMRGGRLKEASQSLERAYAIFQTGQSAHGRFFMSVHLALCQLFLGKLGTAESLLQRSRGILEQDLGGDPIYAGILHSIETLHLYERNELLAAGHIAQMALSGLEKAEGCFEQYLMAAFVGASVAHAVSGVDAAMNIIGRGRRLARFHGLPVMERILNILSAQFNAEAGMWPVAAELCAKMEPEAKQNWLERTFSSPLQCLVAIQEGRLDEARGRATMMIAHCTASGRVPAEIRARLLLALASSAAGDVETTQAELGMAIALATPEAILQPFFEIDERLLRLLRELYRTQHAQLPPAQAGFLNSVILRIVATGKARDHGERLTAREREILGHLTQGVSNKVIARSLDLTENAVKFHLKNVFRKLGVESRTMAAAVAERMTTEPGFPHRSPDRRAADLGGISPAAEFLDRNIAV
jgi:LuxR family maltose regulon positive regulatory protein